MAKETEDKELLPDVVKAGVLTLLQHKELGFYLVAESEGKLVGSLMITTEWSDWRNGIFWWIQSVYVEPNSRRKGAFRALYQEVEKLSKEESNVCGYRLYVEKENLAAQAVYRSLGLEETHYRLFEKEVDPRQS